MKTAIIDIGSNSVRLMLWAGGTTLYKKLSTTRLGEGIAASPVLKPEAIERSALAVAAFYQEGLEAGAEKVYAFATAAVRSARNGAEFCARVKELCGLEVDVVSGETEALLGIYGALGKEDGTIIDIGGASTEVCCRKSGKIVTAVSLNVGAVRLYDWCKDEREALLRTVKEKVSPLESVNLSGRVVAIGGTATTLASVKLELSQYDAKQIQDFQMTAEEVRVLSEKLVSLSKEERRLLSGMDEKRADIIAGGALLLAEILKTCKIGRIYVSDRDNLEGYAMLRGIK